MRPDPVDPVEVMLFGFALGVITTIVAVLLIGWVF
jgi:hypothetical protein